MVKIFEDAGELILGTRLKKLGDRFLDDVSAIYRELDMEFEAAWFAIFFMLDKYGKLTMSEMASNLGVSQSAISQTIASMEKKNMIEIKITSKDKRRKVVWLTEDALELLSKIKPVWKSIKKEMENMLNEGEKSRYMLDTLSELENLFEQKSLTKRVLENIQNTNFRMERYKHQYFKECKRLLFSWIFEYGLPYIDFIKNMQHTLNNNEIYLSFSDEHITAMAIILNKKGKNEIFIINKNDYEDGSYLFLLSNILKKQKGGYSVYIDIKKANAKNVLAQGGYKYKKSIKFSEDAGELAVFEADYE